jgi:glycosyltransferase involved in cell wall biosynthesis
VSAVLAQADALLAQGKAEEAYVVLKDELQKDRTADVLRLFVASCLETKRLDEANAANAEINLTNPHDLGFYLFQSFIHEKKNELHEALEAAKMGLCLASRNEDFFKRVQKLIAKLNVANEYALSADYVFCTGGPFFARKFNPTTLDKEGLGGSESALIAMAREFARHGKRVLVFCNCDKPGEYDGVRYLAIHDFETYHRLNAYRNVIALRIKDAFEGDPHAKTEFTFWLQDAPGTELYRPPFDPKAYRIRQIFVLSESHKRAWQTHFGLPEEIFFVTKNGYDPELFFPRKERKNRIVYASRPERGLKEAVLAFRGLQKTFPDLELVVCTYTQEKNIWDDPAIRDVKELLEAPGIRFLGSLSKRDFATELGQAKLLFHPNVLSAIETSCIAAIEAQASGVPVICGRGGALEETVRNGKTGVVIDFQGDQNLLVSQMISAATELLQNPEGWQKLATQAHDWAFENYRWSLICESWLQFFEKSPAQA